MNIGHSVIDMDIDPKWTLSSAPEIRRFLGHKSIAVLKMDCEGCEYSLPEKILETDPSFFQHVTQFAVEIHVSKFWIKSQRHVNNLALLWKLLKQAGLELMGGDLTSCSPFHEASGCPEIFAEVNFPCESKLMCQNYFFARVSSL